MNAALNGIKNSEANRQRKAVRTLAHIADRLGDTKRIPSNPPPEVDQTSKTEMDEKIFRLFKAVQTLATWRFDDRASLREPDVRNAFDEIA